MTTGRTARLDRVLGARLPGPPDVLRRGPFREGAFASPLHSERRAARMAEATEGMTQAGLIVGTPHYMSPEQVQGQTLDSRSDVYSMGVMLYEILSGEKPFTSTSLTGVLTAHITEKPRPLSELRPEIGREVSAIVMRCLEKDRKNRYADAGALLTDLDRVQTAVPQAA